MREALERSLNVATVRLARDVGHAQRGRRRRNASASRVRCRRCRASRSVPRRYRRSSSRAPTRRSRAAACGRRRRRWKTSSIRPAAVLARRELRFQRVLDPGHRLPGDLAARGRGRARHRRGAARGRTARADRREDRHHRRRARSVVRRLHARSRRRRVDRFRRAAQRRHPRRARAHCRSGAASSRRSSGGDRARRVPAAGRDRARGDHTVWRDRTRAAAPRTAPSTSCPVPSDYVLPATGTGRGIGANSARLLRVAARSSLIAALACAVCLALGCGAGLYATGGGDAPRVSEIAAQGDDQLRASPAARARGPRRR